MYCTMNDLLPLVVEATTKPHEDSQESAKNTTDHRSRRRSSAVLSPCHLADQKLSKLPSELQNRSEAQTDSVGSPDRF